MHAQSITDIISLGGSESRDHQVDELLLEAAEQMETLGLFADQVAWDDLISRLRSTAVSIRKGATSC